MSGKRPWTVIAYIVADDSREPALNQFAQDELTALKNAGRDEDVRVISYVDFTGSNKSVRCVTDGSRGSTDEACESPPETNVATTAALRKFFTFARNNSPGNSRYAVVFWGHGAGPAGLFLDPSPTPPRSLSLPQVWQAFQALSLPIDVILFKDCWVSTLEAAYEFDDVAEFIIAAQGLVPIPGVWPFRELFKRLKTAGDPLDRRSAATLLGPLEEHYENEDNRGRPSLDHVLFSVLDLTKAKGRLAAPLRELVEALQVVSGQTRIASRKAMEKSGGGDPALIDVRTVCAKLQTLNHPALAAKAKALDVVLADLVVDQTDGTSGIPPSESLKGVSLFRRPNTMLSQSNFVTSVFLSNYQHLSLSGATGWTEIAFETALS